MKKEKEKKEKVGKKATKSELKERKIVNGALAESRVATQKVKKSKAPSLKLGEITVAVVAEDEEIAFFGKAVLDAMKNRVAMANRISKEEIRAGAKPVVIQRMKDHLATYDSFFDFNKATLAYLMSKHPLSRVTGIKGFTDYQLGLVVSYIKDPKRFPTFSQLAVYSGVAPKNGRVVTLATLNQHKKDKHASFTGNAEDFTEFGFNVQLKSRFYNIVDCLLKAKGFFYYEYVKARKHIEQRCINSGEAFLVDDAYNLANPKAKLTVGRYYMKDVLNPDGSVKVQYKNYSLDSFTNNNARWRQARTLLNIIYVEWLESLGEKARGLYAIEYLGHQQHIKLQDVLNYETIQKSDKAEAKRIAKLEADSDSIITEREGEGIED